MSSGKAAVVGFGGGGGGGGTGVGAADAGAATLDKMVFFHSFELIDIRRDPLPN